MFSSSVIFRFSYQFSFKPLYRYYPANFRLDEYVLKTSRRRLSSSSSEVFFKTSSRRLDEDKNICLTHKASEEVCGPNNGLSHTSSRHLQDVLPRRLQNVFKTSCKNVFKTSSTRLQDVFKTSWRPFQDILKTSPRLLKDVLKRFLQDVFKMITLKYSC